MFNIFIPFDSPSFVHCLYPIIFIKAGSKKIIFLCLLDTKTTVATCLVLQVVYNPGCLILSSRATTVSYQRAWLTPEKRLNLIVATVWSIQGKK